MTFDEAKARLAEICAGIVRQNHELIAGLDEPDFDPSVRLDNTKNNAAYRLTDFFDILKSFPYGGIPCEVTNEVVTTTDELLEKIRQKYGDEPAVFDEIIRVGQAFRNSKRIWRIANPVRPLDCGEYEHRLDQALCTILCALDDLNFALSRLPVKKKAKKRGGGKGPQSNFKRQQREAFVKFLDRKPITPSVSAITRAHQCWNEHRKEWDAAAKTGTGYSVYQSLARAI